MRMNRHLLLLDKDYFTSQATVEVFTLILFSSICVSYEPLTFHIGELKDDLFFFSFATLI